MKWLPAAVGAAFLLLLATTLYLGSRHDEGLVDREYYETASRAFAERELEEREGFTVRVPDRYRVGENRFAAEIATKGGPLRDARVAVTAMRPGGTAQDRRVVLRDAAPGRYEGTVLLPSAGQWMLSLAVDAGEFRARRLWTVAASPGEAPSSPDNVLRGSAGDQDVLLSVTPWPPRAMRNLVFAVTLPKYPGGEAPHIDLSMRGMDMGWNRVPLARQADGTYRGTGVFVRCPSGRDDWEAEVTVPGKGKAVFRIDVAD